MHFRAEPSGRRDAAAAAARYASPMNVQADVTTPLRSRWDQEDAEFVASDAEWIRRCAARMADADGFLTIELATGMALELSAAGEIRARSPESVAEGLLRVSDIGIC